MLLVLLDLLLLEVDDLLGLQGDLLRGERLPIRTVLHHHHFRIQAKVWHAAKHVGESLGLSLLDWFLLNFLNGLFDHRFLMLLSDDFSCNFGFLHMRFGVSLRLFSFLGNRLIVLLGPGLVDHLLAATLTLLAAALGPLALWSGLTRLALATALLARGGLSGGLL